MRAIKYRELKQMYDKAGPAKTVKHLSEALEQGRLRPEDHHTFQAQIPSVPSHHPRPSRIRPG